MLDDLIKTADTKDNQQHTNKQESASEIVLHGRFRVLQTKKISHFSFNADAFEVEDKEQEYNDLYALVLNPDMLPRIDILELLFRRAIKGMQPIAGWSIEYYPPKQRRLPIILLEKPTQPSLRDMIKDLSKPMTYAHIIEHFLKPIEHQLNALRDANVTYRSFSLDNIFWDGTEENKPILGECYSKTAGAAQPVYCETINRMLCPTLLRGLGASSTDMFALATITCFLLDPANNIMHMNNHEIISQRLLNGSFHTYTNNIHLEIQMNEFLRGCLYDVDSERWELKDFQQWLDGILKTLKNPFIPKKARRPFTINDHKCLTLREVAYHAAKDWELWRELYNAGGLDTWLRNEIADSYTTDKFSGMRLKYEYIKNEDIRLCLGLHSLDGSSPLMYKGHIFMPDSIANFIKVHIHDAEELEDITQLLNTNIHNIWLEQVKEDAYFKKVHKSFSGSVHYMTNTSLGMGLPRTLFQLSATALCYSPYFEKDFVHDMWYLLPACNRFLEQGGEMKSVLDPFISAYIAAKYVRNVDEDFRKIQAQLNTRKTIKTDKQLREANSRLMIAEAKVIAEIQEKVNNNMPLPALCLYYVSRLSDAISLYNSRTLQRQVRKELSQVGRNGILQEVVDVISEPKRIEMDTRGFESACDVYSETTDDLNELRREMYGIEALANDVGGRISVTLMSTLSVIGTLIIFLMNVI